MTQIILHHYPASPFAEKIRLMLGFKQLPWHSVMIPAIMPKPDLTALTGGYRRTPVMQIGSDIYCDTALIARVIDRLQPLPSLYPAAQSAHQQMTSRWADSSLFAAAVAYAMQPAGLAFRFKDLAAEQIAAFVEDRKQLRQGGTGGLGMPLAQATDLLINALGWLEEQFGSAHQPFCGGATPTIADFSIYHPLWFVHNAGPAAALLQRYPAVLAWLERMRQIGHGQVEKMKSPQAIDIARATPAAPLPPGEGDEVDGCAVGDAVTVAATDYGVDPVMGQLLSTASDEIVIAREDPRAGRVQVHFPRIGYRLTGQTTSTAT